MERKLKWKGDESAVRGGRIWKYCRGWLEVGKMRTRSIVLGLIKDLG